MGLVVRKTKQRFSRILQKLPMPLRMILAADFRIVRTKPETPRLKANPPQAPNP